MKERSINHKTMPNNYRPILKPSIFRDGKHITLPAIPNSAVLTPHESFLLREALLECELKIINPKG